MILALLRLDLNEQSFLCGHDLKTFFERLLPTRDMDYLQYMVKEGTDALQIQGEDKEEVKMAIAEVANHPEPFTDSRTWASVIAKLDLNLRKLRQKYNAPEEAVQTMAILYLIEDDFKSRMALDPRHTDPQAIFTIDIAQKVVRVPALSYLPPVDFRFDFASVFPEVRVERGESGRSLTIPLWQVMIASLHGSIKWQMWSTVFSPRHLSALHTQLNRIVYISPHDLPDHQEDMGERLRDVADACREFNSLIKKAQIIANGRKSQRVARYDEEEGEDDDYWNEDDEDDDNDDGYDNDGGDDDEEEEGAYDDGGQGDSEVSGSESMGLPTRGRQMGVRFAGVDNDQGDHRSVQPSEASPLQESPRPDDVLIDTDAPVHEYNVENRKSDCPDNSLKDTATIILSEPVALTREEQEERYLPALEQLFAASPEQNEATLTREFRKVIGPIVLMAEPLPLNSFATLLDISQASILSQINQLQSAMIEPVVSAEPINLVDVSFRDFVLDPGSQHKHRFWVDEIKTHETISMKCLELLCRAGILRENACSLKSPGYPRADINSHAIDDALPAHVQYACRYWVYHFEKGKWSIPDVSQVTDFLNDHFLHWLEVLSLMGCVVESIAMINTLRSLVNSDNPQVSSFLQDARRFILKNREAIDEAPLQLYSSAIMFLPTSSVIRSTFENHITRSFRQLPVVDLTWDNVLLSLEGHSSGRRFRNSIRTLAFSSDSTMLASGAHDGAIIWCAATGTILLKVTRVSGVRGVAFSPDCSLLALARRDGFVSIHNLEKRSQIQKFKACSAYDYGGVNAVVFSADGNFLASGASDGTITLWDGPKARQMRKFKGHSKGIIALALSPDGLLASGSYDQTARVWEFSSGNLLQTYTRFSKPVETVDFIPDGTLLMASNDGTIKIWDLKESADAQILISSDEHERDQYGPYVNPIVLSPNGKLLAMSPATTVELRDAASGKKVAVIQGRLGRTAALAVSPDNTMLAAATESTIEIWEFHGEKIMDSSHSIIKYKNRRPGRLMVFAPNGKILALADFTTIELWDPTKGTVIRTSDKFGLEINHLTFSPDSEVLAFVCEKSIKIWDLVGVDGVQNIDLGTWYGNVEQMAFSPDRERLAEASLRRIRLWDIATRSVQQILPVLDDVNYITFSSDGSLLACTLKNGMIQRWSLPIGAPLTTLTGHTEPVVRVSFSSDNKMLASASTDGTIRLWNWDTGTVLQEFHGDAGITELSFHDNDRRLGTNLEVFALDDLTIREPYKVSSLPKFGLSTNWVTRDSERLLWLPPDYRADEVISHGSRVALRLKLGGVIFIAWDS